MNDYAGGKRRFAVPLMVMSGVLFSIAMRYLYLPTHESGTDTWMYHQMISYLITDGFAPWLIHPLSYLGMFPFSDSMGSLIIISDISILSGFNIELSVLVQSFINGIMLFFTGFIFGWTFKKNTFFASIVGVVLSFAPILFYSLWEISPRVEVIGFIALIPSLLIMRNNNEKHKGTFMSLAIVLAITAFLVHKLAAFAIIFFIAVFAIWIGRIIWSSGLKVIQVYSKYIKISILILVITMIFYMKNILHASFLESYEAGALLQGSSIPAQLINIGVSIIGGTGIFVVPFGIVGIIILLWKGTHNYGEIYIFCCLVLLLPLLFVRTYIRLFVPIVFSILIAIGAIEIARWLAKFDRKKLTALGIGALFVVGSPIFAHFMTLYWLEKEPSYVSESAPNSVVEASIYLDASSDNTRDFIALNHLIGYQMACYSGWTSLPANYAPANWFALYSGLFSPDRINPEWVGIASYLYKSGLELEGSYDYNSLVTSPVDTDKAKHILTKYNVRYVIQDKVLGNYLLGYYYTDKYHSKFMESVQQSKYELYENSRIAIWAI